MKKRMRMKRTKWTKRTKNDSLMGGISSDSSGCKHYRSSYLSLCCIPTVLYSGKDIVFSD
jgi:hypothetical protein